MLLPVPCPTCGTPLDDCRTAHGSGSAECAHVFAIDSLAHFTAKRDDPPIEPKPDATCFRCGIAYGSLPLKATG